MLTGLGSVDRKMHILGHTNFEKTKQHQRPHGM
jgi:hypothetical protein